MGSAWRDEERIKQIASGPNDMSLYVTAETARGENQWESRSRPLVADDPPRLRNEGIDIKFGQNFFLDEKIPRHESGKGFVSVTEKSLVWRHEGSTIFTLQGLMMNKSGGQGWTIMSSIWNHLRKR